MMASVPVRPAPAAPNKDVIIAIPWTDPNTTAILLPNKVPTPAAKKGAARPPVRPANH